MSDIALKIALIGAAGIAAQWLAWRLHLPAIVLLLVAGFAAGPLTGYVEPAADFGEIYRPLVSLAVAIILFEGGLTLNFKEIRETSTAVRRVIILAGPLVWSMTAVSAHYLGGLSWPTSIVLGSLLIVTGPTVVMPLLRSARLSKRPASILKWEAIVNDPIGALGAVIALEAILVLHGHHKAQSLVLVVILGAVIAIAGGYAVAKGIELAFIRGHVPEYLKAPVLFSAVLASYAVTNMVLEEAGLLTVTVMGITLANTRIASLAEIRRFKEMITILLVSGIFILLAASLTAADVADLDWRTAMFVFSVIFVIRPVAIMLATTGSGATLAERAFTAWIAPRGVVAVAVSGLFGAVLTDLGIADASSMVTFTFAVVVSTIVLHGFTLRPLASLLGLREMEEPGIIIAGGWRWTTALAEKLKAMDVPVTIAEHNWNRTFAARQADVPVYFGDILSESAHNTIEPGHYAHLIAATDNDSYNALVCTNFAPDLGRSNVFQPGRHGKSGRDTLNFTLGGRKLTEADLSFEDFLTRHREGWTFQSTRLTEKFTFEDYIASRPEEAVALLWVKPSGSIVFRSIAKTDPQTDDRILTFSPKIDNTAPPAEMGPALDTGKEIPT